VAGREAYRGVEYRPTGTDLRFVWRGFGSMVYVYCGCGQRQGGPLATFEIAGKVPARPPFAEAVAGFVAECDRWVREDEDRIRAVVRAMDPMRGTPAAPPQPGATVLRLLRAHCHPDVHAAEFLALVLRASNPPDAEMARFKAELRDLLGGGVDRLPASALYAAVSYDEDDDEDDDESFLRRLWWDCYGNEPYQIPDRSSSTVED
jgi:hypothetical protein